MTFPIFCDPAAVRRRIFQAAYEIAEGREHPVETSELGSGPDPFRTDAGTLTSTGALLCVTIAAANSVDKVSRRAGVSPEAPGFEQFLMCEAAGAARILVNGGADPGVPGPGGIRALDVAARSGLVDLTQVLVGAPHKDDTPDTPAPVFNLRAAMEVPPGGGPSPYYALKGRLAALRECGRGSSLYAQRLEDLIARLKEGPAPPILG